MLVVLSMSFVIVFAYSEKVEVNANSFDEYAVDVRFNKSSASFKFDYSRMLAHFFPFQDPSNVVYPDDDYFRGISVKGTEEYLACYPSAKRKFITFLGRPTMNFISRRNYEPGYFGFWIAPPRVEEVTGAIYFVMEDEYDPDLSYKFGFHFEYEKRTGSAMMRPHCSIWSVKFRKSIKSYKSIVTGMQTARGSIDVIHEFGILYTARCVKFFFDGTEIGNSCDQLRSFRFPSECGGHLTYGDRRIKFCPHFEVGYVRELEEYEESAKKFPVSVLESEEKSKEAEVRLYRMRYVKGALVYPFLGENDIKNRKLAKAELIIPKEEKEKKAEKKEDDEACEAKDEL